MVICFVLTDAEIPVKAGFFSGLVSAINNVSTAISNVNTTLNSLMDQDMLSNEGTVYRMRQNIDPRVEPGGQIIFVPQSMEWGKVPDADGYDVYVAKCGKSFGSEPVITVGEDVTKTVLSDRNYSKANYKVRVKAWKMVKGEKVIIGTSLVLHSAGDKTKYTNAKKVTLSEKYLVLDVKTNDTLKPVVVLADDKRNLSKHMKKVRYWSSDSSVAAVNASVRITAKKPGNCIISA